MDVVADLLGRVRARGALVTRSVQLAPWSLTFADRAGLAVEVVVGGDAWVSRPGEAPRPLAPGDVLLVQAGPPYTLGDLPDTPPQVVVYGRGRCGRPGEPVEHAGDRWRLPGPRTYGNAGDAEHPGATVVLRGAYEIEGDVCDRLLGAIPGLAIVPADPVTAPVVELLAREIARDEPGQDAVLDRLLDLLLVLAVRQWFARPEADPPAWYTALSDPIVGPALRLMHEDPGHRWTVGGMAAEVGASRAAFARRFASVVGEPPLAYLTGLRMALAAEMLATPGATVAEVATRVGYGDGFGFSAAFKRARGVPPSRWRDEVYAAAASGAGAGWGAIAPRRASHHEVVMRAIR